MTSPSASQPRRTSIAAETSRAGFVMPAMLAMLVVIALVTGVILETARRAEQRARMIEQRALASYAADTAIARASMAIADAIGLHAPPPGVLSWPLNGAIATVRIEREDSRIDLNLADAATLQHALESVGADETTARRLASAIVDRRAEAPWRRVASLADLSGMDGDTATCLERVVTPYGGAAHEAKEETKDAAAEWGVPYRMSVSVAPPSSSAMPEAFVAVVRLSGDPAHPLLVHQWSPHRQVVQTAECFHGPVT